VNNNRMAVVGVGATGTVLAGTLLSKYPETFLIGRKPDLGQMLGSKGIHISGEINCDAAVQNYSSQIGDLKEFKPSLIFLTMKTFHLEDVLENLREVFEPGMKIIACQNGLGPEDLVAERLGRESVLRMSLNYGVSLKGPGEVAVIFFNRPHYLGSLSDQNKELGKRIADQLTACGHDTEFVDDIKLFVWKKMIMKCTMASLCAVTDKTIKEALDYPPTREIADACFEEAMAVARAMGYDLDENYLQQARGYLQKAGVHKDSMCIDIENRTPTEIDFLGAKVVEYGRAKGISTPFTLTLTNLVKALESNYLNLA